MTEISTQWEHFVSESRIKPPLYLGGIDNFLIRNSVVLPLRLAFSPELFSTTTGATLYASQEQYLWFFDSVGVTDELKQRSEWEGPNLLQNLLMLDVNLYDEKQLSVFQQPVRILWASFCNLVFASSGFTGLRLGETFCKQSYTDGLPTGDICNSDTVHTSTGLMIGAELNKEWFHEIPFSLQQIKQSIPRKLARRVEVIWQEDGLELDDLVQQRRPIGQNDLRNHNTA